MSGTAIITSDPAIIADANKVVLPGVGAFADAIAELKRRELIEPIRSIIDAGKPFLGVCLGLQLLFDTSYEDGAHQGLGIVSGQVRRFELPPEYKVPHMGWNQVRIRTSPTGNRSPIFEGIEDDSYFYFVHSYYVAPNDENTISGETSYGNPFCAMIWRENLFATQFHPEKSQKNGLRLLKNFAELG